MAIDFLKNPNNTVPPPPLTLEYSDDEMTHIRRSAEHTVFIQLFGRKLGNFQLGSSLHGFFKLDGRVEVSEHGHCRYSAKFSSQQDYDRATQRSTWQISDHYSIEIYKWQPNFQFGKVPLFRDGDFVEARLEGLPIEYFADRAVFKLVNAVCEPLGCPVLMVDSSKGKPPRFWFQLIDSKCSDLPLQVEIVNGPLVGLSYSRAQQCYHCGGFGHFRKTCPELNQQTRSLNRATPSTGPSQVHLSHFSRQPVPVSDLSSSTSLPEDTQGGIQDHESPMSSEESCEGTSEITPFSPIKFFARCSGSISPSRPIEEMEMGAKGVMLVENGRESRAKLYNIGEEVCEIDVAVKVTNLNDQRGNQRRVTITPRAGNVPRCSKKLLYTTIEDIEDRTALRALKDTCDEKDVSMAIVFDKSSVLTNDDQIVRRFGFSHSHSSEMTFRSFGSDGYARDVKGNCLLMWNGEELRVNVSQLLSQHLEFNASWLVVESDSDESSNGFSSSQGESSIASSQNGDTDSDESSFSSSGEGISNESSTSSSSSSESSISLLNLATHSEESSLFSTELRMSSKESREGTSEITPFSPIKFFARCSGSISPSRPIEEMEMGAKGVMLVENGGESRARLYNIGEEVCEIDVAVKVTNLNDQRGNQRRVTITPRAGNVPRCSKKLLYTTIEDIEDRNALRALKDTCDEKDVSMAIVFDKSSVLTNHHQIVRCFGFSDSHSSEMTFRSFGSDGYARDVRGACLLMWNGEELRVNVSPVSDGNTQLLSQHLEFNATWLVVESDSDESSNGFSSSQGESSIDSSQNGDTDSDESSWFSFSGEGISNESSTSSSSTSESSFSLLNSATNSEESSLFSTDAEEISNGSSAPPTSEEDNESFASEEGNEPFALSPNSE